MTQQLKSAVKPSRKTRPVVVKMAPDEFAVIYAKSQRWAGGNVSVFLREAGKHWTPGKEDLTDAVAPDAKPVSKSK